MKTVLLVVCVMICSHNAIANDDESRLAAARSAYEQGDLDAALEQLEPLLERDPAKDEYAAAARRNAAHILHRRGVDHFRNARIRAAIEDYKREIELLPELAPGHWQLGIAYYYAEEYQKGVEQFELHQTVNPEDVENAVWHFLCAVRAPNGTVATARKNFIPISQDPRVPMREIHRLFAGGAQPQDVLKVAQGAGPRAKFYADLYLGLYFEALGRGDESQRYMEAAAKNPAAEGSNMGDIARVHHQLRADQAARRAADR